MLKLGELLKSTRSEKGLSLSKVSEKTKIPIEQLKALEEGDYDSFSSEVYLKGFLKNYSSFLGIDSPKVLALYRRERKEYKEESLQDSQRPLKEPKALITPGRIVFITIALLVLSVIAFIVIQVNKLIRPPELELIEPIAGFAPSELVLEVNTDSIILMGKVEVGSELFINGTEVTTNNLQEFRVDNFKLKEGSNEIFIVAESYYFSKTSEIKLTVISSPKNEVKKETKTEDKKPKEITEMKTDIEVGNESAWLVLSIDGKNELEQVVDPGSKYSFTAKNNLTIYSPRTDLIDFKINNKAYELNPQSATLFKLIDGEVIQE